MSYLVSNQQEMKRMSCQEERGHFYPKGKVRDNVSRKIYNSVISEHQIDVFRT